ncbi:chorismate synthase [Spirochaetota bacterium]|nr:chorismate synthase [Spirochaetota bacterium]
MAGDSIGLLFRVTNWGESHGAGLGVVVAGVPPGITILPADIQKDLDARRPGQNRFTTSRQEKDVIKILSGIENNETTGTPILLMIENHDHRPKDYKNIETVFRPSHADFTYTAKYGLRSKSGGGRSSARLTAGSVAAGAIAKQVLTHAFATDILAYVKSIATTCSPYDTTAVLREDVLANPIKTTDTKTAEKMIALIDTARDNGDSLGGIIECRITNVPVGLGEPIYDKLDADLAKAILAINACKGFELGSGFKGTQLRGSEHNDAFIKTDHLSAPNNSSSKKTPPKKSTSTETASDPTTAAYQLTQNIRTKTNHSGGIQGGISNGMPIVFRAAFKPTATILQKQQTVTETHKPTTFQAQGRHDPCVLPRAVPIVEAMAAIVLCDHFLRHRGQVGHFYTS